MTSVEAAAVVQPQSPITIQFFLPGGSLPSREIRVRLTGGGLEKSVSTDSKGSLQIDRAAGRMGVITLTVEGDKTSFATTTARIFLGSSITHSPVFLTPLGKEVPKPAPDAPDLEHYDAKAPAEARAAYALALKAVEEDKLEMAISQYTRVLTFHPQHLRAINELGMFLFKRGLLTDAATAFTHAASIRSRFSAPRLNLAYTLIRKGELGEATLTLQSLLTDYPELTSARLTFAELLARGQQWDEAARELRTALADRKLEKEKRALAHLRLGQILLREERYNAASKEFEKALGEAPNGPDEIEIRMQLGSALLQLKRMDEAERELTKAYELGGKRAASAQAVLGQLYFERRKFDLALRAYEQYLKDLPNPPDLAQVRQQIEKINAELKK
jgi:tetratricopeptide (TPR) repeat protein